MTLPNPLHVGQAPLGELNENSEGVGLAYWISLSGQCKPVENFQSSVLPSSPTYTLRRPLPRLIAVSMASITRDLSAPCTLNLSATTSSTLRSPLGVATSRSACTLVKPLADSHCITSSGEVCAGNSTGKVSTTRGSAARVRSTSWA